MLVVLFVDVSYYLFVSTVKAVTVSGTANSGPPVPTTVGPNATGKANGANGTENEADADMQPPTDEEEDDEQPPGAFSGPAPAIPDWYKVGWRDVSGVDEPVAAGEVRDKHIIASFISDQVCFSPEAELVLLSGLCV